MNTDYRRCRDCKFWFKATPLAPGFVFKCPFCGHQWTESLTNVVVTETTTDRAVAWLHGVAETLKEKGRLYGNSIDNPVAVFSKADKSDGLAIRIDDKLARIRAASPDDSEDSVADLVGYIALWKGSK
jgi:hypothetical protein